MSGFPSSLPGIDVAAGLARVAGNEKLYLKLLRHVAAEAPTIQEQLATAVMNGDAAAARDGAHSLKGAAGNLSLIDLTEAASQLEAAAKENDFPAMFTLLDELEKAFQAYVNVIEGLGTV